MGADKAYRFSVRRRNLLNQVARGRGVHGTLRPRRPGAFGTEACVEGPVAASSRIEMRSSPRHPLLGSGRRCRNFLVQDPTPGH